jgi:hypothetical protein
MARILAAGLCRGEIALVDEQQAVLFSRGHEQVAVTESLAPDRLRLAIERLRRPGHPVVEYRRELCRLMATSGCSPQSLAPEASACGTGLGARGCRSWRTREVVHARGHGRVLVAEALRKAASDS